MKIAKSLFLLSFASVLALTACSNPTTTSPSNKEQATVEKGNTVDFTYTKYEIDTPDKVTLGKEDAPHTIYLAFDYSCPWCKKWMAENLPKLIEKYVDTGIANYKSQPVALLNEHSLTMAEADYIIENKIPDKYYEIQRAFAADSNEDPEQKVWGTEEYVVNKLKTMGIDYNQLKKDVKVPDRLQLTRKFTKKYGVQFVPTVYVDGIKVSDSFSLEEIDNLINEKIKEGQMIQVPNE